MAGASRLLAVDPRQFEALDPGEYERMGRQIAAAEREISGTASSFPLVVVAGLSTAREDIDADLLGSALCGGTRVLNLGSSGGSFRELAFYLRSLERTTLRSRLSILAVHPVWLAGRTHLATAATGTMRAPSSSPVALTNLPDFIQSHVWVLENRRGIHGALFNLLWQVRESIADRFGLPPHNVFAISDVSPWSPRISYHAPRADDWEWRRQLSAWRGFGWFDSTNFAPNVADASYVRTGIERLRVLGGPVVVVLMPEHSRLRQLVPSTAYAAFRLALGTPTNVRLIDLRAALPDSLFYDYAHLNETGRREFSGLLGHRVRGDPRCGAADSRVRKRSHVDRHREGH
jgi:hypothetical protein